jgi:hypothetical protein
MFSGVNESNHNEKYSLLQPLAEINPVSFYGRCAGLVLLAVWSWYLIGYDYRFAEINLSFMHDILLPIHEAGHVLFRPFGEFMTILGGSLFQVMSHSSGRIVTTSAVRWGSGWVASVWSMCRLISTMRCTLT